MKNFVYVDAENVAYPDFKRYFDDNFNGILVHGRAYGNQQVVGDSSLDYIRLGFDFIDTSCFTSSSKNVADMKILTDCAFDVAQSTNVSNITVTLITKDCDFLPLVYRLVSAGVNVSVPFMGKDKTEQVPMSAITLAIKEHGYDPMSQNNWMEPQLPLMQELLSCEFSANQIAAFCNRKRSRFIHDVATKDPTLASALDSIPENQFGLRTVFKEMRKSSCAIEEIIYYIKKYTGKYFGLTLKDSEIQKSLTSMY